MDTSVLDAVDDRVFSVVGQHVGTQDGGIKLFSRPSRRELKNLRQGYRDRIASRIPVRRVSNKTLISLIAALKDMI
jgi:hypothetical protein